LNIETLKKYDSQEMYKTYDCWPEFAQEGYNQNKKFRGIENVNHIVFCGMGGSGAIGDMFASILSKTKIHVSIVKGYLLPSTINENSLIVTISISGNTIETLTALESAIMEKCKVIAISSGGKMEEFCKKYNIDFRKIPQNHSPRASFTRFLFSLIKILEDLLPITENSVNESIKELEKTRKMISSTNLTDSNPSLQLAKWIKEIPLIYYPWGLNAAATRFKNSLQENSKTHVIAEDVIEACHNGIVAWEKSSNVQPILLQGTDDNEKTKDRWRILKEYFFENRIEYKEISSVKGDILSKLINLIYLLDYTSIYHAILSETDPSTIKSIEFIKKRS